MVCSHYPTPGSIKMACVELCRGVHTGPHTKTDYNGFFTYVIGICVVQCEHTIKLDVLYISNNRLFVNFETLEDY